MPPNIFKFDDVEIDQRRYELRRGGRVVKLEKTPMELLLLLVGRYGELVTREEISSRLWSKGLYVDTNQSINTAIRKIRQALRDNAKQPCFVQTVVGKGYRFVDCVTAAENVTARPIIGEARIALTPEDQVALARRSLPIPAAYEAYLKGRYHWNQGTEADLRKGIELFKVSVALDQSFALAYSGLADCYTRLGYQGYLAPKDAFPPAKAAAAHALDLDATLPEPHASLAYARLYFDWDWAGAEDEFQTALALNPNYATGHHWYSVYLTARGQSRKALAQIKRAQTLNPLSVLINTDFGFEAFYGGYLDEAIQQLHTVIVTDPKYSPAHFWLGRAYQEKRMYKEAIIEYKQAASVLRDWPSCMAALGNVYGLSHRRWEALKVLGELKDLSQKKYVTPYKFALVYAGLGERNRALGLLDKGYAERTPWLVWLKLDPRWNSLRSEPRFKDLVRRVGPPR